jgi:hypothetical protein
MKNAGVFFVFFLFFRFHCFGAGDFTVAGGRAAGMGFSAVAVSDGWSVFNNQAGIAWQNRPGAGFYFENRFLLKELSFKAMYLLLPVKSGAFGLSVHQFGFSLYNEFSAGLVYARAFGKHFAAGVGLDWLRIHLAEQYGTRNLVTFEIGLQYRSSKSLSIGAHIYSPWPVRISGTFKENIPTLICFGASWNGLKNLVIALDLEKSIQQKPALKGGLEYRLANPLYIRIGMVTDPMEFTFGVGIESGKIRFNISSGYNWMLGYSPQADLVVHFK